MNIAYVRVSTVEQNEARQLEGLKKYNIDKWFTEKISGKDVPVAGKIENFADYDTVLLGFPIWYYGAPNVVGTFCKGYDWAGKKLVIFATSGGSSIGKTAEKLAPYIKGAEVLGAKVVRSAEEAAELLG